MHTGAHIKAIVIVFIGVFLASCATAPKQPPAKTKPSTAPLAPIPTATDVNAIPQVAIRLLKQREGFSDTVYVGHNGKLTAGIGHVLVGRELQDYPLGTQVPSSVIEGWTKTDTSGSWVAALRQANTIGDLRLAEPLFAVNYQLGINWYLVHKKTWALLLKRDWDNVGTEIMDSKWCRQTPLRCTDFQQALQKL